MGRSNGQNTSIDPDASPQSVDRSLGHELSGAQQQEPIYFNDRLDCWVITGYCEAVTTPRSDAFKTVKEEDRRQPANPDEAEAMARFGEHGQTW